MCPGVFCFRDVAVLGAGETFANCTGIGKKRAGSHPGRTSAAVWCCHLFKLAGEPPFQVRDALVHQGCDDCNDGEAHHDQREVNKRP